MKHLFFSMLGILAFAAGCKDLPQQPSAEAPPEEAPVQAAAAPAAAPGDASTLCVAYRKQLAASRAELAAAPRDETLQETVQTFEAVITDACN